MSFPEKLKRAFQKNKGRLIVFALFSLVMLCLLVAPVSIMYGNGAISAANQNKAAIGTDVVKFDFKACFESIEQIKKPFDSIQKAFSDTYFPYFWGGVKIYFVIAVFFILVGLVKGMPKNEFTDIENGSSDWCTGGEQYRVLSKREGIILAEKNYLPVDKRGNVNVLVVRRIWCW